MYGLAECDTVSSTNRKKNEKRLPTTTTSPVREIQLRSKDRRSAGLFVLSVLMSIQRVLQRSKGRSIAHPSRQAKNYWPAATAMLEARPPRPELLARTFSQFLR